MSRARMFAVFAIAFLCGLGGIVGSALVARFAQARSTAASVAVREPVAVQDLAEGVLVSGQIAPEDLDALAARGIRTIVSLRPDGEAPDPVDAARIGALAGERGLDFAHIPMPRDGLPDAAVDRLAALLARTPGPVLLSCRSGKRAARAWALAEAARPDGLPAAEIAQRVRAIGQPIDDLADRIRLRAALRAAASQ